MPLITTGDDVAIPVTLRKNGQTFAIGAEASVRAVLVPLSRSHALCDPVETDSSVPGSDWAHSLVVIEIPSAVSLGIEVPDGGRALLEIQVDDGGKTTWTAPVSLARGTLAEMTPEPEPEGD